MFIKHFKHFSICKRIKFLLFVAVLFALFLSLACGKRKPPLPPIERVPQRVEISGFQRGNKINLTWQMPARNAPDGSVLNIDHVEVYRLAEEITAPPSIDEEEFASRSTMIYSVPVSDADFAKKTLIYADSLDFAGQTVRLRYSIRFVNASGQRAAFSNFLLIEPTARIADVPKILEAKVTESSILLSLDSPTANIDGSQPVNFLGFNLYRSMKGLETFSQLNRTPINKSTFSDTSFEFGKEYKYFARAVSLGGNGQPIESLDSNTIEVQPKDTFVPSPPTAITIAATPNSLSIFFAFNTERDIAGYRIYRTENQNLAKADWPLLTPNLLTTNTFQDKNVVSGKTYYYYLTAVDKFGNVSEPSEVVSETIP
jgi:hypothetical protein